MDFNEAEHVNLGTRVLVSESNMPLGGMTRENLLKLKKLDLFAQWEVHKAFPPCSKKRIYIVTTSHSFHLFCLILSLVFLCYLISCIAFILFGHVTALSKDWVMWYDVTGTLIPIKGPGFHCIPGCSMGFYFLPCNVIPLRLFGHFSVVYIGLLCCIYNLRIDLV